MTEINTKAFDECKLISEEKIEETVISSYFCGSGFIETTNSPTSFEIKSYQFGYSKKIEKEPKSIF